MSSLMLINPRKRTGKKRRSAAQRAATARMLSANRARRHNPAKRHTRRRRHNPIGLARVTHTRRHNPIHRMRHRRRRNPIGMGGAGDIGNMLINGLKGAGGAVIVNAITNFMPAAVKTGNVQYVTRVALALVLGTVGKKMLGSNARVMAEGSMTVTLHDLINSFAGTMLPGGQMHGMGAYMSAISSAQNPQMIGNAQGNPVDTELHGMGEYLYR